MASIIKLKRSSTPGSVPGALDTGEVALNLSDQVLFTYDGNNVVRIGGKWLANTNNFIKSQLANTNSFIKSQLANTNSYIATKVSTSTFNSALANTNARDNTQDSRLTLINTNLTGTNTAIRSLISTNAATELSHLANTNTYIATKVNTTTFNSALANTNSWIKSQLANTNAYIATKVNTTTFNSALANTNSWIKSQLANTNSWNTTQDSRLNLINTNLTATNTAIRSVISTNAATELSHLANTNTYIATKVNTTTFNSALANTNTYIATKANATNPTTSGLHAHTGRATISTNLSVSGNTSVVGLKANNSLGTSGYVLKTNGTSAYWDAIGSQTQYLQVANAVATYATKSNPTTSGLHAHTGRATISTNLAVTGNTSIGGNLLVSGNLEVDGAVTYISTSTVKIDDSMIKLAANNAGNSIDTGVYAKYVTGAVTKYAGYFLDSSDGIFKFYTGSHVEPTTTVNTGAAGYAQGQVDAIIDGGSY